MVISIGSIVENICIAASSKNYYSQTTIRHDGSVLVYLQKQAVETKSTYLWLQIRRQQTNRSQFSGEKIGIEQLHYLQAVAFNTGIGIRYYSNDSRQFSLIADFIEEANHIQMQNSAFTDELKLWIRFNKKQVEDTNDGLSYSSFGIPNLPLFIAKPIISHYFKAKSLNKIDRKKIVSSSHFMLLVTEHDTLIECVKLGQTLQRLLLTCCQLDIAYSYMNQPNHIECLRLEMMDELGLTQYPTILLRIGYGKPQPYSNRKTITEFIIK